MTRATGFGAGAFTACALLAVLELARVLGVEAPRAVALLACSATAVLAATGAVRHLAFIRRGPVIVSFRRQDGVLCDAREAQAIRAAAQLRGTMGGAGYLHPWRMAISAAAWAAAAVQAVALLLPDRGAATYLPLAGAALAVGLASLFPAAPFFYREAAGGCVVAFPAEACRRVLGSAREGEALAPVLVGAASPSAAEEAVASPGTLREGSPGARDDHAKA